FCLHAKRLRDADRGIGAAVAIAVLYALAVILFLLLVALIIPLGDAAPPAGAGNLLALFLPVSALVAGSRLFAYVAPGIFVLVFAPVPMAVAFSIWAATRPTVTSAPPSPARAAAPCVAPGRSSANRTG